jgi:hypothetical protein
MTIDRSRLVSILDALGQKLAKPTTVWLIGSSPGILRGQPDRQLAGIDIWRPASAYDETDLRRACEELGILFDPKGELDLEAIYLKVVAQVRTAISSSAAPVFCETSRGVRSSLYSDLPLADNALLPVI